MTRWLIYVAVLIVGAAIGYAYMEVQSQQLVERITATEAQLAEAGNAAEDLRTQVGALERELEEKVKLVEEQTARIVSLEAQLAAQPAAE